MLDLRAMRRSTLLVVLLIPAASSARKRAFFNLLREVTGGSWTARVRPTGSGGRARVNLADAPGSTFPGGESHQAPAQFIERMKTV
jgi:hypothetical protein